MAKIVYNACFGGFSLSHKAIRAYAARKGIQVYALRSKRDANGGLLNDYEPAPDDDDWNTIFFTTPDGSDDTHFYDREFPRTDPDLVAVVEELGDEANGMCAKLRIAEVPSGTQYRIDEYDGRETIETRDSIDWTIAP